MILNYTEIIIDIYNAAIQIGGIFFMDIVKRGKNICRKSNVLQYS